MRTVSGDDGAGLPAEGAGIATITRVRRAMLAAFGPHLLEPLAGQTRRGGVRVARGYGA